MKEVEELDRTGETAHTCIHDGLKNFECGLKLKNKEGRRGRNFFFLRANFNSASSHV